MSLVHRFFSLILLATSAILLASAPSSAELKYDYQEAPNGDTRLVISGMMSVYDDLAVLEDILRRNVISYVTFDSTGGDLRAAIDIGRILRRYGMPTRQTNEFRCLSSCTYAFLGGVERRAVPQSLGVHQIYFSERAKLSRDKEAWLFQFLFGQLLMYFEEMELNIAVLQIALTIDPNDMFFFNAKELRSFDIAEVGNVSDIQDFASISKLGGRAIRVRSGPVPLPGAKPQ